MTGYFEFY